MSFQLIGVCVEYGVYIYDSGENPFKKQTSLELRMHDSGENLFKKNKKQLRLIAGAAPG